MTEGVPDAFTTIVVAHAALKRAGDPEDVADVAAWLATDKARSVNGQAFWSTADRHRRLALNHVAAAA